jgi:hypothetical protein
MSHWSTQSSSYDTQISEHAIETGKEPGECLFSTHSTVLGSSTTPQGRTLARPSCSVLLPVNHQALARSILLARVSTPCTCHGGIRIRLRAEPDTARQRVMTLRGGGRCQLRGPGTQSTKRSSRPCQKNLHTPPPSPVFCWLPTRPPPRIGCCLRAASRPSQSSAGPHYASPSYRTLSLCSKPSQPVFCPLSKAPRPNSH